MANPSPDEGVRAALEPAVTEAAGRIFDIMCGGRLDWRKRVAAGDHDDIFASADWDMAEAYARAALSTPVPEEGLPRGSASAAEGDEPEDEDDTEGAWRNLALQFDGHRIEALSWLKAMVANPFANIEGARDFLAAPPLPGEKVLAERIAALSTEAGDGVASALPSPLHSQGELDWRDAFISYRDDPHSSKNLREAFFRGWYDREQIAAEALAAERARADRVEEALKAMHRRAQQSERIRETAIGEFKVWLSVLGKRHGRERYLFQWALERVVRLDERLRARAILKETPVNILSDPKVVDF